MSSCGPTGSEVAARLDDARPASGIPAGARLGSAVEDAIGLELGNLIGDSGSMFGRLAVAAFDVDLVIEPDSGDRMALSRVNRSPFKPSCFFVTWTSKANV